MIYGEQISVFGATGFIGSEYCRQFSRNCYLEDREEIYPQHDEVVYFISTTDNYNIFGDIFVDAEVNIIHLLRVLDGCKKRGVKKFNFISSWFVYGEVDLPAKEDMCCTPKGFYSITKKCAEELVESFCRTFNIRYKIYRLANVYGASDNGVSKKKNALQYLIAEISAGRNINLYHGGNFYRDYLHVKDVANAIEVVRCELPFNQIVNIGSGQRVLFKDIIEQAHRYLDSKSELKSIEPPQFHKIIQVKDFYMDCSKLHSTSFKQEINIKAGIREICQQIT